jgi:glycerol-3-phosphate dehydrogenase
MGKGILVSPTIHDNIILGPASDDISDRENTGTTEEIFDKVKEGAKLLIPKISTRNNIRNFAGIRAEPSTGDFIIKEAKNAPNFIDVAGIKSPGLTAAPAIALHVVSIIKEKEHTLYKTALKEKKTFNPIVKRKLLHELPEEEQSLIIKKNPLYGRTICRCENITEGDIVDAIRRKPGAVTLDGVKRRCRAGMGRCQGSFCGPRVQQIIARELNKPLEEIVMDKKKSYILTGKVK